MLAQYRIVEEQPVDIPRPHSSLHRPYHLRRRQ